MLYSFDVTQVEDFRNLSKAMFSLFVCITQDAWVDILQVLFVYVFRVHFQVQVNTVCLFS